MSLAVPVSLVCVVEIDRFAALRQRIGYEVANDLVSALASRISEIVPDYRLGRINRTSVEFAFDATSSTSAGSLLTALVVELENPFRVDGADFDLTVTIGAAHTRPETVDERQLDAAAAALAIAQARREKVVIADPASQDQIGVEQMSIMRDLRRAMSNDELSLHYQPKLHCRSRTIASAEALLRWHHPGIGLVRTDKLIDIAEATGAIRKLTLWTINRAVEDQARLAAAGNLLTIYVNISAQLLSDAAFAAWALTKLADVEGKIGFEITETAVIKDPKMAIEHLNRFSDAGIRIAIDDYGSGLSSLSYLKQLPAHELKIDQMFISGLTESHRDPLLVRSSIDLAHALEMEVTAEGVDDPISLSLLQVMGCDMVQGYLVSPPLPIDEFMAFLKVGAHLSQTEALTPSLHGWNVASPATAIQP